MRRREPGPRPSGELTGRVAIVTDAGPGIGAATVRELTSRGAQVVAAGRGADELPAQARSNAGGEAEILTMPADICDAGQAERLVARVRHVFGRVDVLVNNSAGAWYKMLAHSSPDEISGIVGTNLTGTILMTRAVLPGMLEQSQGAIINVSSLGGRVAVEPLYSATMYGIRGFSLAVRRQLANSRISVSLVSLGDVRLHMSTHVHARMPGPDEVARMIASLIKRPRRELIVTARFHAALLLEEGLRDLARAAYGWRDRGNGAA